MGPEGWETSMAALRIGLIGANPDIGWASRTHLPAIGAMEGVSLAAACTTKAESARKAADMYAAQHALTDPAALVALPDVDLVVVSVRAPMHAAMVELALEAGKPVFCEWPLGAGAQQSERLAKLATDKGLPNFVCLQGFAAPAALAMREIVAAKALGEVLSAHMAGTFNPWGATVDPAGTYLCDAANGVSAASIIGGHSLHMLGSIVGGWQTFHPSAANRRTASRIVETGTDIPKTAPDQFVASGMLQSGALASLHIAGGIAGREGCDMVVHCEEGSLRMKMPTVPEILPPSLEQAVDGGEFAAVPIDPRFRKAPASLGEGPAVNVAQLYALIAEDMAQGTRQAPDFAEALALRRQIAQTGY